MPCVVLLAPINFGDADWRLQSHVVPNSHLQATGKPVVVFVINAGPVDLSWAKENVAAVVSAGYGGEYGGQVFLPVCLDFDYFAHNV